MTDEQLMKERERIQKELKNQIKMPKEYMVSTLNVLLLAAYGVNEGGFMTDIMATLSVVCERLGLKDDCEIYITPSDYRPLLRYVPDEETDE